MKSLRFAFIACALVLFAAGANAQSVNNTSSSTTNTASSAGANAQTNGNTQALVLESSAIPTRTTERIESAPAIALGSFGVSFSSNNCSNTVAGAVSVIKLGLSAGKAIPERSCSFIVQGTFFGNMANHYEQMVEVNLQHHDYQAATRNADIQHRWEAMAGFAGCNTSPDELKACETLGLVKPVKDGDGDVTYVPSFPFPAGTDQVDPAKVAAIQQRENSSTQNQQRTIYSGPVTSQTSIVASTPNPNSLENQRWYQNAQQNAIH